MKKIVIIDDEPDSLQIMRDVLEEYTCRVYTATTAKQGMKFIEEVQPDLVFLDLRLPDKSGEDLLPVIREKYPKVKVIIGTAFGDQELKEALLGKGAEGFFDKPIDINAFEKKARQLIGPLSEIRILIIDDEAEFCQIFKDILENDIETKWVVHFANTGEQGVSAAEQIMPDLISLDICLSLKGDTRRLSSGLSVYRELKSRGFHIPVVVLASYIDSSDAEDLNKEGLAAVFSKSDLMGSANMTHFLNVLKRIALRGSYTPKTGGGHH